jgi:oxygen-independent coproporphyrinogen-3 oxidase
MKTAPAAAGARLVVDRELIRKYDLSGPRYTSYPTADRFVDACGEAEVRHWAGRRGLGNAVKPLSLYLHLPFCDTLCWYCACNKVITRDHGRSAEYVRYLTKELSHYSTLLGAERRVCQLHLGGGTPTFLGEEELAALCSALWSVFDREPAPECAIEVDPRGVEPGRMHLLAGLGFNRVSVGVQDFDPLVQRAVHRIQPEEETRRVIDEARASGFRSVNIDLIYGLPRQSVGSFDETLRKVIGILPDRIALYAYAHLPATFKPQRRIVEAELPAPAEKLDILTLAIQRLTDAGYVHIGMDHFARPDDELAVAQRQGRLQRNFQGYSTQAGSDLLGLGVSAISAIGPAYSQNHKRLDDYYAALDDGRLPVARGLALSHDDLARRAIIQSLVCNFRLSIEAIELAWLIDFRRHFAAELEDLAALADDGLVEISEDWITVTPQGRLLVRAVCMVFDRYMRTTQERHRYSRLI